MVFSLWQTWEESSPAEMTGSSGAYYRFIRCRVGKDLVPVWRLLLCPIDSVLCLTNKRKVMKKEYQCADASLLFRKENKIITIGRGWEGLWRKRGGREKKMEQDQEWEETGEKYRGSGNWTEVCSNGRWELGVANRKSQSKESKRLPGPNGDDFSWNI